MSNEPGRDRPKSATSEMPLPLPAGRWGHRLAWLPIPVLFAALLLLWRADLQGAHESQFLLMLFNFFFSTLASVTVAILVGRSFVARGAPGLLLLGGGIVIWGAAGTLAPLLLSHGIDVVIGIHNTLVCFAAFCCLAGAVLSMKPRPALGQRGLILTMAYACAVCAVWFVVLLSLLRWMPVFFVQGEGGTPIRGFVLGMAAAMFAFAAALLGFSNRPSPSAFVRWYAPALLLVATGIFGIMIESVLGGALSWTARAAQFLGGAYMIVAAIASVRETGRWDIPLEQALRASEERYHALFNGMTEGFAIHEVVTDEQGTPVDYRFLDINPAFERLTGLKREEVVGRTHNEILPGDDPKWLRMYGAVAQTGEAVRFDNYSPALQRHYAVLAYRPAPGQFAVVFRDVTGQKQVEDQLHRLNRTLRAHSRSDQALLRAGDEAAYLRAVCRVIVEDCGHAMVWVGMAQQDEARSVLPVACAGFEEGYLDTLRITWADAERGRGPTGTAIRTGQARVCRNMLTDPAFAPWRAEALRRGYASSIALPMMAEGRAFGALTIYSREPDPFSDEEVKLLTELAGDFAHGVQTIRLRAAHALAEEALRESERRERERAEELAVLLEAVPMPVFIAHDPDCLHLVGNRLANEILRVPRDGELSLSGPPESKPRHFRVFKEGRELRIDELPAQRAARGEHVRDFEITLVFDDGMVRHVLGYGTPLLDDRGRPRGAVVSLVDITERKKAEEALRLSEQRLALAQKSADAGMWDWDMTTEKLEWSAEMFRLFGLDPAQAKASFEAWRGALHPDDRKGADERIRQAIQSHARLENECRVLLPSGEVRWVSALGDTTYDAAGRPLRMSGICIDITERKKAESVLQTTLQRFYSVLSSMYSGVLLVTDAGRVEFANQAFCDRFGLKDAPADLVGLASRDMIEKIKSGYLHSEEAGSRILEIVARGKPVKGEELAMKNGETCLRDFVPLNIQGKSYGRLWIHVDITERKLAEEALSLSEEKFARAFASNPAAVAMTRLEDGRFLEVNDTWVAMNGYSREEVIGRPAGTLSIWPTAEARALFIRELREKGAVRGWEEEFRRKSGERFVAQLSAQVLTVRGERVVLSTLVDITARKQAERQLKELNETLEQRVAERTAEAHRLADQLRALASDLSMTEQRERKRLATILHDHVQQLLVAATMQLGLIKRADRRTVESTVQGVESIIKEAIAASRSLTVELSPPILHQGGLAAALGWLAGRMEEKSLFKVHVRANNDAEPASEPVRLLLFESIRELLLNALKHSGVREAHVTMLRTGEGWTKILVEDKGCGLHPDSLSPQSGGGFGLFSIQQRLAYLGGVMEVESAPGQGTRIILTAPSADAPLAAAARPAAAPAPAPAQPEKAPAGNVRRIRLLLVDDHKIMRQGLSSLIQLEADIEVVGEARNGEEALELARRLAPDVVVTDVSMPGMSGVELTRILRNQMPAIKVLGLSMHIEKGIAAAMQQAGAAGYLTKGGLSEDLIAAIRAAAAKL